MKAVKLIKLLQAGVAAMGEDVYVDLTGGEVRFMQYIRHELPSIPVRSTKADVQQWTVERLAYYGLNVISGCRAKLTLRTPQLEEIQVVSYFALSDKSKGQKASFTVSGFNDPTNSWVLFTVKPWSRIYLRRREEVIENLGEKALKDDMAFVSISRGNHRDLLENRIHEFLGM